MLLSEDFRHNFAHEQYDKCDEDSFENETKNRECAEIECLIDDVRRENDDRYIHQVVCDEDSCKQMFGFLQ